QASYISKTVEPTWKGIFLYANGTYGLPTYSFLFNSYNGNVEPKDGIYMTRGTRAFSPFDDANTIFGECRYANYYFQTLPDQEVYVSHVNGKLRISFCNLVYGGDDGTSTMFSSTF